MSVRDDRLEHLPRGTVTLVFADVEGSTRLLHELGDRYAGIRARKRELVREVIAPHGGHEVDWAGDGAFLAFERARDAVRAAVELQRALAAEPWPAETSVRLRIGIHTGEPQLDADGYVGTDVHVAARICSAAHGGQIVVSRTTRDFFGDDAGELSFRALGSHRLKDVPAPEQLFQVVAAALPDVFPPLKTLGGATLPSLHHRLVGRRQDLTAALGLLSRPDVRLVTITGPGGAGKSRLALEVAALTAVERPVHLVGLAPVSDASLIPSAIATALGVRESASHSLAASVSDSLAGSGALLYLDNLEHLPDAAQHVGALLDLVPDLDILTTSRTPLRLSAEHVVPLQPLAVQDAATLFAELAAARGVVLREDTLPAVREICRRLDGLPLAIELVAARLALLPPAQLLQALDEGLALDMEGPIDLPERQRTLRATIDWSYGLLTESQRELHLALAVFVGGATLDDARAVGGAPASFFTDLEALVAGSLVRSDVSDGAVRLFMLETVREDALARLAEAGRLEELRARHAGRFLELARAAEGELAGAEPASWLDRLEQELDNLRVTFEWLLETGQVEDVLRAVAGLDRFWRAHAHVGEARRWLAAGEGLAGDVPAEVRAGALKTAAQQAAAQSDWDAAAPLLEEAIRLYHEGRQGADEVVSLAYLSFIELRREDRARGAELSKRAVALARRVGDPKATSFALMSLGDVCWVEGSHDRAIAYYEEAVDLRRGIGDQLLVCDGVYNLGMAAFQGGDTTRAREAFEEALGLARELGEAQHTAAAEFMLAHLDALEGQYVTAAAHARESLALYGTFEDDRSCARCVVILAGAAAADGAFENAARLLGAARALRRGQAADEFEQPILDGVLPQVESALGSRRLTELQTEGDRQRSDVVSREVVLTATGE